MAAPRRQPGETRQAILDALRGRPMVEKELMLAVGCTSHSAVSRQISRLRSEGLITRGYVLTPAAGEGK